SRLQVAGYEDWFPDETRLVELFTHNEEVLPIDRKLAMESIDRLLDISNDINFGIIREGQEHALQLANPGIETCRFCEFRPSCQPYLDELKGWMAEGVTEIYDVIGELISEPKEHILHSPTGGVLIEDEEGQKWRISGIELEAERHRDTLEAVECGQIVGVFNCYNVAETLPDLGYNFIARASKTNHVFYASNAE
ncbi:MAG: hypothetical protein VX473_06715, partial [Candidatus Thermoplasmatota archaeon]|nr:hypothetical protein [Candidatus Thermoplasmatota archaeon]